MFVNMSCKAHGQHQDRGWKVKLQSLIGLEGLFPRTRTAAEVQLRVRLKPVVASVDPALLPQVKYEYGKASFEKLKAAGANADFRTYKYLQHGVDPQEVQVG